MLTKFLIIKKCLKSVLTESGKKEAKNRNQIVVDFLYHLFEEDNALEWIDYLNKYLKNKNEKLQKFVKNT